MLINTFPVVHKIRIVAWARLIYRKLGIEAGKREGTQMQAYDGCRYVKVDQQLFYGKLNQNSSMGKIHPLKIGG
jgi:hypothetical protein